VYDGTYGTDNTYETGDVGGTYGMDGTDGIGEVNEVGEIGDIEKTDGIDIDDEEDIASFLQNENYETEDLDYTMQLSLECSNEYNTYSTCLNALGLSPTQSLDTEKEINGMGEYCNIVESTVCESFYKDITSAKTACLGNFEEGGEGQESNSIVGLSILSARQNYLFFCSKDDNGDLCPFSRLLLDDSNQSDDVDDMNNGGDNSSNVPDIIKNDCLNETCNKRMLLLSDVINAVKEAINNIEGDDENADNDDDDDNQFNKYLDYYKSNNCNSFLQAVAYSGVDFIPQKITLLTTILIIHIIIIFI